MICFVLLWFFLETKSQREGFAQISVILLHLFGASQKEQRHSVESYRFKVSKFCFQFWIQDSAMSDAGKVTSLGKQGNTRPKAPWIVDCIDKKQKHEGEERPGNTEATVSI